MVVARWRLDDAGLPPRAGVPREWSTKVWCSTATWYGVAVPGMVVVAGGAAVVVVDAGASPARRSRLRMGRSPSGAISGYLPDVPALVVVELCAPAGPTTSAAASAIATTSAADAGRRVTGAPPRGRRRRRAARAATPHERGGVRPPRCCPSGRGA